MFNQKLLRPEPEAASPVVKITPENFRFSQKFNNVISSKTYSVEFYVI